MMNKRILIWTGFLLTVLFAGLLELLQHHYSKDLLPQGVTHAVAGGSVTVSLLLFTLGVIEMISRTRIETQELVGLHIGAERRNTQFAALPNAAFAMTSEAVFQQVIDLAREVASARYSARPYWMRTAK
jgi:hypothetical protein